MIHRKPVTTGFLKSQFQARGGGGTRGVAAAC